MRVHNWNSRKAFNHRVINEHLKTVSNIATNFIFKLFLRYLHKKRGDLKTQQLRKTEIGKNVFSFFLRAKRTAKCICISALKFTIYLEEEKQ